MTTDYCQAKRADGSPCPNPGIHIHKTDPGVVVNVCGTHLRMLKKRERLDSDEQKLEAWGIPVPS
jgi:hypothetical protein